MNTNTHIKLSTRLSKLKGAKIKAFGPNSRGLWGTNPQSIEFKIKDVEYEDNLLNVYLEKYNSKETGLIYTDPRFLRMLQAYLIRFGIDADIHYSEQGMQGDDYVNFDFNFKGFRNSVSEPVGEPV